MLPIKVSRGILLILDQNLPYLLEVRTRLALGRQSARAASRSRSFLTG